MKELVEKIIAVLTGGQSSSSSSEAWDVINGFNNVDEVSLNGNIAVSVGGVEYIHNGDAKDKRITIVVSGQYLTEEDLNQAKIMTMYDYIVSTVEDTDWRTIEDDIAGFILGNASINSDGSLNTCSITFELIVCKD